ncbi:MAG: exodeoxyribonuclease VII small subunit [Halioglobus sp.]|jgi:exodeoxyribonuclease VII small subunit
MPAKPPAPEANEAALEPTLQRLESIVEEMEDSSMGLEEALKAYTAGVQLTRKAQTILAQAEQKVQLLLEENGEVSAQPFAGGEPEQ